MDPTTRSRPRQVIQTVPHVTVTTQPIVLQALSSSGPITGIQTFTESSHQVPTTSLAGEAILSEVGGGTAQFRDRSGAATTYFNAIATPLAGFMPPYNFYNIANVVEADTLQHR